MSKSSIPTWYRETLFGSRTEAKWAVFFDHLGIPWQFEPRMVELAPLPDPTTSAGAVHREYYRPDFWLPDQSLWFEVKGPEPHDDVWTKLFRFAWLLSPRDRIAVAVGDNPNPKYVTKEGPHATWPNPFDDTTEKSLYVRVAQTGKGGHGGAWTRCRTCGAYDLTPGADEWRINCPCPGPGPDRLHNGNDPEILEAYASAQFAKADGDDVLTPGRTRGRSKKPKSPPGFDDPFGSRNANPFA